MKKRKKSSFANFGILLAVLTILVLLAGAVYLTFYMSGKSISVLKNGFSGDIITIQEPDIYITETEGAAGHSFIFVGDSRTAGMATAVKAHEPSDTCRFIAKEGEGYEWLKNEGTSELAAALSETPDTTVILNLGVNDITEADAYISYYKQLFASYPDTDFHLMSVNPVSDDCPTVTNAAIDAFNQKIKAAFPDEYLDVYNYLLTGDFSTVDGLHYTDSTYLSIHYYLAQRILSN